MEVNYALSEMAQWAPQTDLAVDAEQCQNGLQYRSSSITCYVTMSFEDGGVLAECAGLLSLTTGAGWCCCAASSACRTG